MFVSPPFVCQSVSLKLGSPELSPSPGLFLVPILPSPSVYLQIQVAGEILKSLLACFPGEGCKDSVGTGRVNMISPLPPLLHPISV